MFHAAVTLLKATPSFGLSQISSGQRLMNSACSSVQKAEKRERGGGNKRKFGQRIKVSRIYKAGNSAFISSIQRTDTTDTCSKLSPGRH